MENPIKATPFYSLLLVRKCLASGSVTQISKLNFDFILTIVYHFFTHALRLSNDAGSQPKTRYFPPPPTSLLRAPDTTINTHIVPFLLTVTDDEMGCAEEKLEASKKLAETAMYNVVDNDVEQLSQLCAFVAAKMDFHKQNTAVLEALQGELQQR